MSGLEAFVDMLRNRYADGCTARIGAEYATTIVADYDALKARAESVRCEPVEAGGCAPPVVASAPISLKQRARDILAAEYERNGFYGAADDARSPEPSPHCRVTLDAIAAALANQQGVGAGADEANRLLRDVVDNLAGVGCEPCIGSHSPMEDLHGRIERYLSTQQPEVPDGDTR